MINQIRAERCAISGRICNYCRSTACGNRYIDVEKLPPTINATTRLATPCLICAELVTVSDKYDIPKICDKCKAAVMKIRKEIEGTAE